MLPFTSCRGAAGSKQRQKAFPRCWPQGSSPAADASSVPQSCKAAAVSCGGGDWGKQAIFLDGAWRGQRSPVPALALPPAAPRLPGLTPAAGGFAELCLRATADTFQQAATQTSKGWHVCFLKQLSRFYWAIKYSDEDIKTKL